MKKDEVERLHALGPVARELDMSLPTVKKKCKELGIELVDLGGRSLRISDSDLRRLMAGRKSS